MLERDDFNHKQIIVVFSHKKEKFSYRNSNMVVTDADGKVKYQVPCYNIFSVFIIGECSITSGMIKHANKFGYCICMFTTSFRLYGMIGDRMQGNTLLHRKQYEYSGDEIARHIVIDKLLSEKKLLLKKQNKSDGCVFAIKKIDRFIQEIQEEPDINSLRGIEGNAAKLYFAEQFDFCNWQSRRPREKRDVINTSLDIGYTLLFNLIEALLKLYDFDIYCGVYHREFYMRKSLICDIMEPARVIVDDAVRKAFTLNVIAEGDFKVYQGQYQIDYKKSPVLVSYVLEKLMEHKEALFVYVKYYYRSFMKEKNVNKFPLLSEEDI